MILETALMCMAANIYHEAGNQSMIGQMAVGQVVLNRVEDTRFPDTVCEVVKQAVTYKGTNKPVLHKCQFSWYCDGKSDNPREPTSIDKAHWVAWLVLNGHIFDFTRGATHYHADYVNPKWNRHKEVERVVQIDNHIFYRWN